MVNYFKCYKIPVVPLTICLLHALCITVEASISFNGTARFFMSSGGLFSDLVGELIILCDECGLSFTWPHQS